MVGLYDLVNNENNFPTLELIKEYDIDPNVSRTARDFAYDIDCVMNISGYDSEHSYVVALDSNGFIKAIGLLGVGNITTVICSTRNVAIYLSLMGANSFVMIHNHPSFNLEASADDIVTKVFLDDFKNVLKMEQKHNLIITPYGFHDIVTNETEDLYDLIEG